MTEEDFAEWKHMLITKEVLQHLHKRREELRDQVLDSISIQVSKNEYTNSRSVYIAGAISGLNELLELTFLDFEMEE